MSRRAMLQPRGWRPRPRGAIPVRAATRRAGRSALAGQVAAGQVSARSRMRR